MSEGDKAIMREMATVAAKAVVEEFKKELKGNIRAMFIGASLVMIASSGGTIGALKLLQVF